MRFRYLPNLVSRLARETRKSFSTDVSHSQAPQMVFAKYPKELGEWNKMYIEEKAACHEVYLEMIDDIDKLPCLREGRDNFKEKFGETMRYIEHGNSIWTNLTVYYTRMMKGEKLTKEELKNARLLSNFIILTVGNNFIIDDTIDGGLVRNGKKCWWRAGGLRRAVRDVDPCIVVELELARLYFGDKVWYDKIVDCSVRSNFRMFEGQLIDLANEVRRPATEDDTGIKWELYTPQHYEALAFQKSSAFMERMMMSAMYSCGVDDEVTLRKATDIIDQVGYLVQVTNDWFDWAQWDHSDIHNNRDLGKDIRLGKPSYSATIAWASADESQRRFLKKHYGVNDSETVDKVVRLYKELGVPEKHAKYERDTCNYTFKLIDEWDSKKTGVPREMLPAAFTNVFTYFGDDLKSFADNK